MISDPDELRLALNRLYKQVNYHNILYHQKNTPEITDAEYGFLKRRVYEIEEQLQEFHENPNNIGAAPDEKFAKVQHKEPMLSLDNAYDERDVEKFLSRVKRFLNIGELM
jgi:DNA ligase (NAD+)